MFHAATNLNVIPGSNGENYTIHTVYHADHGVDAETMAWAVAKVSPKGFFLTTLELPEDHPGLTNNLYGPRAGDAPVAGETLVRDADDEFRGSTPFVDLPPRPTRLLTLIGMSDESNAVTLFTCYGGPAAERIPSDPSLAEDPAGRAAAEAFWAEHALSIAAKK